ncbi:hypothetical protein [Aquimarina agarilytica]|uniref:hypothetical protein n=1 Tax=Aquimarina agarilytica TaxID=1087449 RepID=UPI0002881028|nr:hypothetical protein [Aquimarina agarilytica]
MENIIKIVHSTWAYLVVTILVLATFNAIAGLVSKREYQAKDFRISLFALIVTHLQLVIGLVLLFVSGKILWFTDIPVKDIMRNAEMRLYNVEHPTVMILAIAALTIGYSKHKKKLTSTPKFKFLAIFYSLALLLVLSRIPWNAWF